MGFEKLTVEELIKKLGGYTYKQLHIHHTWAPAHKSFTGQNHMALQQSMKNYHVGTNGWDDIGQHVTLFPDGVYLTGRDFKSTPCSIKGWNTGAFAVEMVGNFDLPSNGAANSLGYDKLEGNQKTAILQLAQYFGGKYGYDSIKFHRDNPTAGKTCPGTSINKDVFLREAKQLNVIKQENIGMVDTTKIKIEGKVYTVNRIIKDDKNYIELRSLEQAGAIVEYDAVNKMPVIYFPRL